MLSLSFTPGHSAYLFAGQQLVAALRAAQLVSRNLETQADLRAIWPHVVDSLVELSGIEPLTSSLRTRRSPS